VHISAQYAVRSAQKKHAARRRNVYFVTSDSNEPITPGTLLENLRSQGFYCLLRTVYCALYFF
jgi:Fe2+ or Zn2+ uptake regulation protein